MARIKAPYNLLALVDSDSEDDLGGFKRKTDTAKPTAKTTKPTASTTTRDMPAAKRGRPAAAGTAANKVTKPAQKKTAAKPRAGAKGAAAAAAAALKAAEADEEHDDEDSDANSTASATNPRSRPVLADRTNEYAEAELEPEPKEKAKPKGRPGRKPVAAPAAPSAETDDSVMEDAPAAVVPKKRGRGRPKATDENNDPSAAAKPAKKSRAAAVAEADETAEDVPAEEEDDETAEPADEMEAETTANDTTHNGAYQSPLRRNKPHLAAAAAASPARPRGSATATSDDASVRRRLGDLNKKYDALEARYRDLREIGIKEAERNFDRLKKQAEERTKTSNDLIASLKEELAVYRGLAKEGEKAQREWDASEARAGELQAQLAELKTALGNAKAESKTLSTKLAAARTTAESSLSMGVVPGSAMKTSAAGKSSSAPIAASARAAVEAMHASTAIAQLKEDLYGDLTGLLVRSAKRDGSRELYDCIQTGRNGSLHFKLCIDDEASSDGEDVQFVYTPQLDPSRDAALIEMLPDYLVEEISFPRMQAAKFYKRVMQSLTEEL